MGRRLCLVLAVALAACAEERPPPGWTGEAPPDVVVFLIDTLRADYLQTYGYERETAPNLAAFAEECVVFEQASAPSPWTMPSVVSLFTGLHLVEHGVTTERKKLSPAVPTLAELLHDYGYSTTSYTVNPFSGDQFGMDRGFETCDLTVAGHRGGKELRSFYRKLPDRPYLLYVHNAEPHDPQHARGFFLESFDPVRPEFLAEYGEATRKYRGLTRIDFGRERPVGTTDNAKAQERQIGRLNAIVDEVRNVYACSVRDADDRLGSAIERIKSDGRWENTLVIVTSDHGEEMSDHGGWQHDQSVYEELLHVPLLVRFPGGAHAGRRIDTPVSLVDLLPTILELTGCPGPERPYTGRSLLALLEGEPAPEAPRVVGMRHNERKYYRPYKETRGDINVAVRQGSWKGIYNVEHDRFELYDLEEDPGERRDAASANPDLAVELQRFAASRYAELLRASISAEEGGLGDASAETLRGLEALGYVGGDEDE